MVNHHEPSHIEELLHIMLTRLKTWLLEKPGFYSLTWRIRERHLAAQWDAFALSYPKCGRTWLRAILGTIAKDHWGVPDLDPFDFGTVSTSSMIPNIRFAHEGNPHLTPARQQCQRRDEFRSFPVVLLVRDPRDVMVSNYFQATKREKYFSGSINEFLVSEQFGVDTYLRYLQIWDQCRGIPKAFLLVKYEHLKQNTFSEMTRILTFLGWEDVSETCVHRAIEACSFEKMKRQEKQGRIHTGRLSPGDPGDPESFKVRRGIVGGYVDYLSDDALALIQTAMKKRLPAYYGYPVD